jgi:hypothetical protein
LKREGLIVTQLGIEDKIRKDLVKEVFREILKEEFQIRKSFGVREK